MHKAVAARLASPNISLYEALLTGGFDYSTNDDKSILDSKKVTLGQRKNQLSRRLRQARKQIARGDTSGTDKALSNAIDTANNNINCKEEQAGDNNLNDKPYIAHSISASNVTTLELADDLVSAGLCNNGDNGNNDATGNRQCKKPRLNNYLRGTSFDRTCTMATATDQKLNHNNSNSNQQLHQAWQQGSNVLNIGGDGTTAAPTLAVATGSLAQATFPSVGPVFSSQISNIISDRQPVQQPYQSGTSAMALSSLSSSAHRVGLTLDQLALTLSSNAASLTKLVSDSRSGESMATQEQLALDIYKVEVKSLYTKCLLIAGVDANLAEQSSPTYTRFASKAWEFEGKRIRSMNDAIFDGIEGVLRPSTKSGKDRSTNDNVVTFQEHNNIRHNHNHDHHVAGSEFGNNNATSANQNDHGHDHDHATANNGLEHDSAKCDARHMHRIGECGHRAIIHQPKDGTAPHIDFIVNDRVECYSGQDSMSLVGRSLDSAWPSKYKCKEVEESSCAKACGKNVSGSKFDNGWAHLEPLVPEPKIFKLSDIDTEDPEWTFDANEDVDGGVLGLFKLGRDSFT
jgi:hypothetical protein